MDPETLARLFVEMYEEAGLDGPPDEMTHTQFQASIKFWPKYEECKAYLLGL